MQKTLRNSAAGELERVVVQETSSSNQRKNAKDKQLIAIISK